MNNNFWKGKKVLITGAGGFIGSYLITRLSDCGVKVTGTYLNKKPVISCNNARLVFADLLRDTEISNICGRDKFDVVVHCAAVDGNAEFKIRNTATVMDQNIRMVSNVLGATVSSGIKNVVIMSSAEIYSNDVESPIKEEDDYRQKFNYGVNGYVMAKITSEILATLNAKQYGLNLFIVRPTNVYGPGDHLEVGLNRVIPSMIRNILSEGRVEIWGDGEQVRNFVYVTDVVDAIICMIETERPSILNIATRESISINNLARIISLKAGKNLILHHNKSKPVGVKKRILDVEKMYSIIDYQPKMLENGIENTIDYYRVENE